MSNVFSVSSDEDMSRVFVELLDYIEDKFQPDDIIADSYSCKIKIESWLNSVSIDTSNCNSNDAKMYQDDFELIKNMVKRIVVVFLDNIPIIKKYAKPF